MADAIPVMKQDVPPVPKKVRKGGKVEEKPTITPSEPGAVYKLPDGTIVKHN